jgi:pimeloyl-ACP methyl ester carboxylesterase
MDDRPRLLLVPGFSELEWAIRPRLEEWAAVASYDLPGVGREPLPDPADFTRELIVRRGLDEIDRHRWERLFIVADGLGLAEAVRIAEARPKAVAGLVLGHAKLSYRRDGERPPISPEVWAAMTQLLNQDHVEFVRYGISQVTHGSVSEELAQQIVERYPKEIMARGWEVVGRDDVPIGEVLRKLDCPMLFAKHEGCLLSTDEGFEDAVSAFPDARTVVVPDAPSSSEEFAEALRAFCLDVWC